MNHNGFKFNNRYISRENIKMNDNENYLYSNGLNSENKYNSLLKMKIPYNDKTSKNLNLEYFKNFSIKNDISSSESGNKKYNFNELRSNIYSNHILIYPTIIYIIIMSFILQIKKTIIFLIIFITKIYNI